MPVTIADFGDPQLAAAASRVAARMKRFESALATVTSRSTTLDTDDRVEQFLEREARLAGTRPATRSSRAVGVDAGEVGFERFVGPTNDLLSVEFLEAGVEAARAVAKIEMIGGDSTGTAFFVGPGVLLTNNHVLSMPQECAAADVVIFDENTRLGQNRPTDYLTLDPERLFVTDVQLDYTFVALSADVEPRSRDCGWLPLLREQGKILVGQPVNIIQHPGGGEKQVVVHNSRLLDLENDTDDSAFCWYTSDTEEGSSGSPVFNSHWEVVALHHKAVPRSNASGEVLDIHGRVMSKQRLKEEPAKVHWVANEGVRCSRIVANLKSTELTNPRQARLRDRLLELWARPEAVRAGFKSGWGRT